MTQEQIREIVKMTIDELGCRKMLSDPYNEILRKTENKLVNFFNSEGDADGIGKALKKFSDDTYIDVIYLQYRDGKTIEWIAEAMDKDESTIKRNKKRLIKAIYESII